MTANIRNYIPYDADWHGLLCKLNFTDPIFNKAVQTNTAGIHIIKALIFNSFTSLHIYISEKPAQSWQAENRRGAFTGAISCFCRLSVPFPEIGLSLCLIHEVLQLCHPAMLR